MTRPKFKLNPAYVIAAALMLVIIFWFAINSGEKANDPAPAPRQTENKLPSVIVERITAQPHNSYIVMHGRTEAVREVSVKAETAGLVVSTPVKEGSYVKAGTLLCRQDEDARGAVLDQAKAALRSRELEYAAAQTLVEKGYRSSTQAASALAALDGARASVKQAEIELSNVQMRAPFSGIFERQIAEIGEYLGPGQACGLLVDLDPMLVIGSASETQVGDIKTGDAAQITLVTGQVVDGKVRFIESKANPATRTFRIEVQVPNSDNALRAGVTASIRLLRGEVMAHLIPSGILSLDEQGTIGVRYLDALNTVRFAAVTTVDDTPRGLWVTGLPESVNLITTGQDYVAIGTKVRTQYDQASDAQGAQSGY